MATDYILSLRDVAVGYGRLVVLPDVNLRLAQGAFIGLLGANGSGKSTLIKTIAGIIPPLSGQIQFQSGNHKTPILGYVPQRESLDASFLLSAFEVALMGVCGRVGPGRMIPAAEREHVKQCLHQAECDDFAHQRFSELSGGQRQRVLIARALAAHPQFLLLDEPTAGIDAAATQSIMELLRKIREQQGITILMVNHDLPMVRRYVEEVIWLRNGTIVQGPASELLSREKIEELLEISWL
ncbi:MAG: metal ABC transporter ATP-binding protein [Verrucomicrobia bacterium]|nr:metal ABC transporter ATP-binding protein [Verrucomicrobiota bacterium]